MKRVLNPLLGGVLMLSFILTGCGDLGNKGLKEPYSFERSQDSFKQELAGSYAMLFSEELCVIKDEKVFVPTDVNSEAAAIFNITDKQVLYSKNAYEELMPASITKVMTALVAIKYGKLTDQVVITQGAMVSEAGATLANIKPGEVYTLEQLLYGLMLPSGNDAGNAIAIHISGSIDEFSKLMDKEAQELGASHTYFKNPHGLTAEGHYTTAYDLYLIFNEALKYSKFREVINTYTYEADYISADHSAATRTWSGGNWYMSGNWDTPEGLKVFGGKTGTTQAAGFCLIMLTTDNHGKEYISVVLKAGSRPNLYENMTGLIQKILE